MVRFEAWFEIHIHRAPQENRVCKGVEDYLDQR